MSLLCALIFSRLFSDCSCGVSSGSSNAVSSGCFGSSFYFFSSSFDAVRVNGSGSIAFTTGEHRYAECNSEKEN